MEGEETEDSMRIKAEKITFSYGKKKVLDDISFLLPEEELVMLVGANGSGKTTLMRILMGFQKSETGMVWYGKEEIQKLSIKERAKKIAYMPQTYKIDIDYTAQEFILLGFTPHLSLFQKPMKKEKDMVQQILQELNLFHLRDLKMSELSGGERQSVYFARARLQKTDWMMLDEPMAALDYGKQHIFIKQLVSYKETYQQGILLSVHDPNYALLSADRVILLKDSTVFGNLSRKETDFQEKLTEKLKQIYGENLTLGRDGNSYFYYWKEQ